jgi:hypothetical protein
VFDGGTTSKTISDPEVTVSAKVTLVGTSIELLRKSLETLTFGAPTGGTTTPAVASVCLVASVTFPTNLGGATGVIRVGILPGVLTFDVAKLIPALAGEVWACNPLKSEFSASTVTVYRTPSVKPVISQVLAGNSLPLAIVLQLKALPLCGVA